MNNDAKLKKKKRMEEHRLAVWMHKQDHDYIYKINDMADPGKRKKWEEFCEQYKDIKGMDTLKSPAYMKQFKQNNN